MPAKKDMPTPDTGKIDETIPGGVYVKEGRVVNALGETLDGWTVDTDGNAVKVSGAPSADVKS